MTRPRPRLMDNTPPRGLTAYEVAYYLGVSETHFHRKLPELRRAGFPEPDSLLRRYDKAAIDRWLDMRSDLAESSDDHGLHQRLGDFRRGAVSRETPS